MNKSSIIPNIKTALIVIIGLLWVIIWIYSYKSPILNFKSILFLTTAAFILFLSFLSELTNRKNKIFLYFLLCVNSLIIYSLFFVDQNTFRGKLIAKKTINTDISDIVRIIEFRDHQEFDEYSPTFFLFDFSIFGIRFRDCYGHGYYEYSKGNYIKLTYINSLSTFEDYLFHSSVNDTLSSYYLDNENLTIEN